MERCDSLKWRRRRSSAAPVGRGGASNDQSPLVTTKAEAAAIGPRGEANLVVCVSLN
jgi:hypothetical protein